MIHATIKMAIPFKNRAEALRILISVAERTRIEPGCISCGIYHGVENKQIIMMDELWQSHEDMERHLRSEDYLKVLLVVEMAIEAPEIRFNTIARSTGVDTIKKARNSPWHLAKRSVK